MSPLDAAVTAIGSFPGVDPRETAQVVRGELTELPVLAELPARGPGADMIGRTLSLLAGVVPEFAGQTTTTGWRITDQVTADLPRVMRRARSWLAEDLDVAEETWFDFDGTFKIQLAGPWTLAASVELPNGERLLADVGACRDLADALSEVVSLHVAEVRRRLPGASLVLQLDEPALPAVLAGRVPSQSGFSAHRMVEAPRATTVLGQVLEAASRADAAPAVHCCGQTPPLAIFRQAQARIIGLDMTLLGSPPDLRQEEQIGELFDAGVMLVAGIGKIAESKGNDLGTSPSNSTASQHSDVEQLLLPLTSTLARLGIPIAEVGAQLLLSSPCGLAGAGSLNRARAVLEELTIASKAIRDGIGEF